MMTHPERRRALLAFCLMAIPAPRAQAARAFPHPDTVATKADMYVVEFEGRAPTQLADGARLLPVTERIALSRVDPRTLPKARVPLLGRRPHGIRRVERNIAFVLHHGAPLPPHARRDLRTTQATPFGALSRAPGNLFFGAPRPRARVGIIDTGLDYTHPDLAGNVGAGVNFLAAGPEPQTPRGLPPPFADEIDDASEMDYNGHGTHIAGIIGARHNDFGIDGIATAVELLGLKVFDRHGTGYLSDILQAVAWATQNGVDILNMSFGTYEHSTLLTEALAAARARGMVLVAAAGNDGIDAATFPAALDFVTSVGALGAGGVSRLSNHGAAVDVFAPGYEVMSTTSCMLGPQVYTAMSGTSQAAAHVTGVLAQAMLHGMPAEEARVYVRERLTQRPVVGDAHGTQTMPTLYAPAVLATLAGRAHHALALTGLQAHQAGDALEVTWRVQNIGNRRSDADVLHLRLWQTQQSVDVDAAEVPALDAGAASVQSRRLPLPQGFVTPDKETSVGVQVTLKQQRLLEAAPISAPLSATPVPRMQVGAIWMPASGAPDQGAAGVRQMRVLLRNHGNAVARGMQVRGFGIPATHEGLWSVPRVGLTDLITLPDVAPQQQMEVALPVQRDLPPAQAWTWLVEISKDAVQLERAMQSWDMLPTGQAQLSYNQRAHMGMVEQAVDLLRLQNIEIADLHALDAPYRGSVETSRDWGSAVSIGMSRWQWHWDTDWPAYPQSARTLVDGASAADGIDVAYGDTGVATWDTHYWIVGEGDGVGLGNVSALHKIYALMTGGWGSGIQDGAIAAYAAGDKARAWWLVGHAAHLLGDLSTGAHTINRNWHGVVGDPYHDWMGKHFAAWPATVPYALGGFVDPFRGDLLSTEERLRFLAYTVARIGASFPWHQTRSWIPGVRGARSGEGSRTLVGDGPHYDAYLRAYFESYPDHPHLTRDISKEEAMTVWNTCIAVDALEDMQFLADCWDGGDGHIDRNNTLYDDIDGDLSRIADKAYTYGVRAIAGLLVLFARETGQIP